MKVVKTRKEDALDIWLHIHTYHRTKPLYTMVLFWCTIYAFN
jgi:hypothetical protein